MRLHIIHESVHFCVSEGLLFQIEAGQCHVGASVTSWSRLGGKDFYPVYAYSRARVIWGQHNVIWCNCTWHLIPSGPQSYCKMALNGLITTYSRMQQVVHARLGLDGLDGAF